MKLVQWLVSIIPALGRLRQIDPHEFEAIFQVSYRVRLLSHKDNNKITNL